MHLLMATHVSEHPHSGSEAGRGTGRAAALTRSPFVREAAWTVAAMVLGMVICAWVLQLWHMRIHVPLSGGGDGLLNVVAIKDVVDHGWYFTNHQLGAPLGQELYDYSAFDGDNLQVAIIKILSLGSSDPAALINVYFVLGFALVSGSTFLTTRALGFSRPVALLGSAIFTALPYHFERGAAHLYLGVYLAVPASCWLMLTTIMGRPVLVAAEGVAGWRRWVTWRTAAVAVAVFVTATTTLYYAMFTVLFCTLFALLRAVITRSWRAALPGIAIAFAAGCVFVVNISPALVYQHQHGKDAAVASRLALESELYATSVTNYLLPIDNHRIPAFARLTARHSASTPVGGEIGQHAGLTMALGFVGLLILLASRVLRGPPARPTQFTALLGAAAVCAVVTMLFAVYGGFSALFAYVVSPQIRAWSRLTPFIAFFSLIGVLAVLEGARARVLAAGRGVPGRIAAATLLVLVGVLAVLDQSTSAYRPNYADNAKNWADVGRMVATMERSVPKDSMILQLPLHSFPEVGPVNKMGDYDEFAPYVHTKTLRWSYGAMKGRPEDWTDDAAGRALPQVLREAVAAGFAGVYIDRGGYLDNGAAVEATVKKVLGVKDAVVGDTSGRLVFYSALGLRAQQQQSLSPAQRATLANDLIHPVALDWGSGTFAPETDANSGQPFRWVSSSASLTVTNPGRQARAMVFRTTAAGLGGSVTFTLPGQAPKTYRFTNGQEDVRIPFTAAPGTSKVTIATDAPREAADPRDLHVQLFNPRLEAGTS